ncbi:MAG: hypothetical protein GY822_32445 [Deltaproteobacteria bacterium]|nr:hypothetical protein [Deltaproteobacteria bacterium]
MEETDELQKRNASSKSPRPAQASSFEDPALIAGAEKLLGNVKRNSARGAAQNLKKQGSKSALLSAQRLSSKPSVTSRLLRGAKKATLASMIGIMTLTAVAPTYADAVQSPVAQTQTQVQTQQRDETGGPESFSLIGAHLMNMQSTTVDAASDTTTDASGPENIGGDVVQEEERSPAVQAQVDEAFSTFEKKVGHLFQPSAKQMARATSAVGRDLSASEKDLVIDAMTDLLQNMPVAAFSSELAASSDSFFYKDKAQTSLSSTVERSRTTANRVESW